MMDHPIPPCGETADHAFERRLRDMNEALLISSLHQHELTEHARRAEALLRESERRHRMIVDQVKDYAIFSMDLQGRATTWNQGVKRVLGFDEGEFLGTDVTQSIFTPEAIRAGVPQRELDAAVANGSAGDNRWMRRKDGTRFYASGVISALRDETGLLVGFTKVMRDQTESNRIETALHDSELRYRRLFEAANDGILLLNFADGKIIGANPFLYQLLGYRSGEFTGKELWEIGLFGDKAASEAAVRELRDDGHIRYEHLPLETQEGEQVEVEFVATVYQEDGDSVIQCNIRDVTDRIRLEKQVREQVKSLAEFHHRKDEFLAMLSHELRNPLSPILNAMHLLRLQGEENMIQQEARRVIERQVGQLTRLVDDLLEISRITTGRVRLQNERLDVRGTVERAVESVRPLIDRRRHELSVSLPPQPIWIHADAARMEQVVVNLLNNAAKYTDDGGQIALAVRQDGDEMVLSVRDTGVGIAPELLPHVFDLFTQADRSLDRSQGGLGIGLSLVQHLVAMHRGTVDVQSEGLGRGSEFTVRLPVLPSPTSQTSAAPPPPSVRTSAGLRVLVVDDNEDSADILAKLLRRSGHDVVTAYTGPTALDAAGAHLPDVVLLDIGLPGINGYEVARRLRLLPQLETVNLIAMTGYGQDADRQLAREAGFDSHLTKPVDFVKVEELLTALLTQPDSSGDAPPEG